LGAGLQGAACAWDLLRSKGVTGVTIADLHTDRLPAFLQASRSERLKVAQLDVNDHAAVRALMQEHDAAMSALPYYFNGHMAALAVEGNCHFSDLGGNTEIVLEQKKLHDKARSCGISVVPDCGLAPGMVNILAAEGIRRLDRAERVKVYVGGLPQKPEPPLNYQIVYSLEGALDYYTTPSWILRDGHPVQVDALSELEAVEFPAPVGTLEAFHTAGGISTLPFKYEGQVDVMEYKTLRYPGHVAIMRPIRELGLIDNTPIMVKGQQVVPRDVFIAAVHPKLHKPKGRDLVALLVKVGGTKGGTRAEVTFRLVDRYDAANGISAMMRTTAFSLSITGQMQADGRVAMKGVHTPDEAIPFSEYVRELGERGVQIEEL
ncbi:MAG TPA: saccharopine dehydrogenase C-terminal domain-containing protein, partial [Gemmatimonadales bacterium]|nr:saccharopine dehydrogenase C-terminal domain-containing protein [Gemmatimonadales bacterium]